MAIYITQGNFSTSAISGMVNNPEDRKAAVESLIKSVGGTLINYYITTGEYDFLLILEIENLTDATAALMIAGASGGVSSLKTVQALTTADAKKAMEKAHAARASYKPPGS